MFKLIHKETNRYATQQTNKKSSIRRTSAMSFLTNAHEDVLVEAPSSRGAHHEIKPATMMDYMYKAVVD